MKFRKKQLVLASLVLALGAAVYLSWQFSEPQVLSTNAETESESSELGVAQLVNNAYVETNTGEGSDIVNVSSSTLSQARMSRQNSRDEAMEVLNSVLETADSDSAAREDAATQASAIAKNIIDESNVENLLSAKGFTEAVAYINNGECSVVVSGQMSESDSIIVQEVVMEQTGLSVDKIKIVSSAPLS